MDNQRQRKDNVSGFTGSNPDTHIIGKRDGLNTDLNRYDREGHLYDPGVNTNPGVNKKNPDISEEHKNQT
jgi:hypothetical protein